MSNKSKKTEELSQSDLINLFLATQSSAKKESNINISPITAVLCLAGVIIVLVQFMIGFGMWSIQDRLSRYDAYEKRLVNLEASVIRFEVVAKDIEELIVDFKTFTQLPRATTTDLDTRMSAYDNRVERIEKRIDTIENKLDKLKN